MAAIEVSRPELRERVVFITGGVFEARTEEFLRTSLASLMHKPYNLPAIRALVAERVRGLARRGVARYRGGPQSPPNSASA